jgi:hypothetical protein
METNGKSSLEMPEDTAYYTAVLTAVFNYYIPEEIKDNIHMSQSTYVWDKSEN